MNFSELEVRISTVLSQNKIQGKGFWALKFFWKSIILIKRYLPKCTKSSFMTYILNYIRWKLILFLLIVSSHAENKLDKFCLQSLLKITILFFTMGNPSIKGEDSWKVNQKIQTYYSLYHIENIIEQLKFMYCNNNNNNTLL